MSDIVMVRQHGQSMDQMQLLWCVQVCSVQFLSKVIHGTSAGFKGSQCGHPFWPPSTKTANSTEQ